MKAILLAIRPEWLVKILNREKIYEIRKLFPKNYVGWIYLYCSKDTSKGYLVELYDHSTDDTLGYSTPYYEINKYAGCGIIPNPLNGKVVARFWCDKVENVGRYNVFEYGTETITPDNFNSMTCLRDDQIREYLGNSKKLFAIHISKLEVFDKPKELNEFWTCGKQVRKGVFNYSIIHKAPQNYCYVEVE